MQFLNDPVLLSRVQSALPAMFHIPWPVLTIGLSLLLVTFEALWLRTGNSDYYRHARFWLKLLLLNFTVGVVGGLPVRGGGFALGMWSWPGVFSSVVALGVAAGYALLGDTSLVIKTGGGLQATSRKHSSQAAWIMLAAAACVTAATPLSYGHVANRWFVMPQVFFPALLPLAGLAAFARLIQTHKRGDEHAPFAWSTVIFMVSFVGLAASLYPCLVPPEISLAAAASSSTTLVFMLVGIRMLLPVMLVYHGFQYLVFRGKILRERPENGSLQGNAGRDSADPVMPGPAESGGY